MNRSFGIRKFFLVCLFLIGMIGAYSLKATASGSDWTSRADSLDELGQVVEGAQARWQAGEAFLDQQDIPAALASFRQASSVFEALEDKISLASCFLSMAEGHLLLGEKEEAKQFLGIAAHNLDSDPSPRLRARKQYLEALLPLETPLAVQALTGSASSHPAIGQAAELPSLSLSSEPAGGGVSPWWFLLFIPVVLLPLGLWFFAVQGTRKEQVAHQETERLRKEMMQKSAQMERENAGLRAELKKHAQAMEELGAEIELERAAKEQELAGQMAKLKIVESQHSQDKADFRKKEVAWESQKELDAESHRLGQLNLLLATMLRSAESLNRLQEQSESLLAQFPEDKWKEEWQSALRDHEFLPWAEFDQKFEACFPGFMQSISTRFPSLTDHDLRLCSLLKLDLASKDMAHLLQITSHAVDVARYRLRKKMELERGQSFSDILGDKLIE